ncbi:hypothetical protein B0T17DRAFT_128307 [Bombardia bombarda]|uniref:Uncharacterized protein n=1 Tax=Bombardia bombarda TaxID=252184 RepID=A0AA39W3Z8_9PEZI|nr:hypothetical protein B0T17DRAFT_128307 [Bombardia bombarda]
MPPHNHLLSNPMSHNNLIIIRVLNARPPLGLHRPTTSFNASSFLSFADPNPWPENGQRLPNGLTLGFSELGCTGSGLSKIFSLEGSIPETIPPEEAAADGSRPLPSTSGMAKSPNSSSSISSSTSSSSTASSDSSLSSRPSPNRSVSLVLSASSFFRLLRRAVRTTPRHHEPRFHALLPTSSSSPLSTSPSLPEPEPLPPCSSSSSSANGLR